VLGRHPRLAASDLKFGHAFEWSSTSVISCRFRLRNILAFGWPTSPKPSRPDALHEHILQIPLLLFFECMAGNLQAISVAGGQLRLSQPLDPNTRASLMFLKDGAPALGKAEMLSLLSRTQQAFRFVALDQNNQRNVQLGIESHLIQNSDEERWIAHRLRPSHRAPAQREAIKIVRSAAFGLVVVSAAYFLHFQLLK